MMKHCLIGIDIGTQGVKTVLVDQDGKTLGSVVKASTLLHPVPGTVEEDPEKQIANACSGIRTVMRQSGIDPAQVVGIGIDGQMAGVIGVGEDGRNVTPYDSWLDTRCAPRIKTMREKAGRRVIEKTGGPPSFNHGPKILWWKHERPEVYARIAAFVQPGGYAAMRLCGLKGDAAFIDHTYLHFSGFADNLRQRWDAALCRTFDVDRAKLPRIVEPQTVVGQLTSAMARCCALRAGIPIVAGCGDTAASFLACGATREGVCVDVAGTASVFAATTKTYKPDTKHQVLGWGRSATPGLWHPYAYINGGGMNLEWFRKELAAHGKEAPTLAQLNARAAKVSPLLDDPMFVPHLGGRVSPSWPDLRGAWANVTWSHTAAHLYRAMLEGVALEYGIYRDVLTELAADLKLREVRVTGGGGKSTLWNQIKADALGLRVVKVTRPEGAPLGAALLAGYGVGLYRSLNATAQRWIKTGTSTSPDRSLRGHYDERLVRYKALFNALHKWSTD
jgi:xylulokinase